MLKIDLNIYEKPFLIFAGYSYQAMKLAEI